MKMKDSTVEIEATDASIPATKKLHQISQSVSDKLYRNLFHHSNDAIIVHDLSGNITDVNVRAVELFKYTSSKFKTLNVRDLHPSVASEESKKALDSISINGSVDFEIDFAKSDGGIFPAEVSSSLIEVDGLKIIHGIVRDVTERKAAEKEMRKVEETNLALLNAPADPSFLLDREGIVLALNDGAAKALGEPPDKLMGKNIVAYFPPDLAKSRKDFIEKVFQTGKPARFEDEMSGVIYDNSIYPIFDEEGRVEKVAVFASDITKRVQIENELRDSEERYRAIWENSPIGICLTDHEGKYGYVNPTYCEIYGYSKDELVGRRFYDVLKRPGDKGDRKETYDRLFKKGEPIPLGEIEFLGSNDELIWVQYTGDFIKEGGIPKYLVSMNIDITERKRVEMALRENEQKYKSIFESFLDFYYQADMDGILINVSPSCYTLSGYTPDELIGRQVLDFYPDPSERKALLDKLFREGLITDYEVTLRDKSRRDIPVSINSRLIRDDQGKPIRIEGTFRDITKRKRDEEALAEREELLRATIESTADGILVVNEKGETTHLNTRFAEMWQIPQEIIDTHDDNKLLSYVMDQLKEPQTFLSKVQDLYKSPDIDMDTLYFKDGRIFERYSCPLIKDKRIAGRVCSFRDISDLKRAELVQTTLHKISEATNRSGDITELLGTIREILGALIDTKNFHIALYDEAAGLYSFPYCVDEHDGTDFPSEQLKKSLTDYVRRTGKPLLADEKTHKVLIEEGEVESIGEPSPIWLGVPLEGPRGVIGVVVVQSYTDPTLYGISDSHLLSFVSGHIALAIERKRTEIELEVEKAYLEQLFESAPEAIVVVGNDGLVIRFNSEFTRMFGYTTSESRGKSIDNLIAPDHLIDEASSITRQVKSGETCSIETQRQRKDGSYVEVSILATPIRVQGGQVAIYAIYRDITDRKHAEKQLKQSEEKYRTLFETIHDGIIITDLKEDIIFVNPAACDIFGYSCEELMAKNLHQLVIDEDIEKLKLETERRKEKKSSRYELSVIKGDGKIRNILISATPYVDDFDDVNGSVCILSDITHIRNSERERQALREKLTNAQRMESLGVLAGGVAHDLNNILGPLVAYPEMIKMELPWDSPILEKVVKIQRSARRAADIVQDLLTMARRGRYEMKNIDINNIIESYLKSPDFMNLKTNQPKVIVKPQLDKTITDIYGSASHLSKVIMNLVINAYDAMPQEGTLTIKTESRYTEKLIGGYSNIDGGNYVILTVSDSGIGIDKEDQKHIFEPFYSKKKLGRSGSGLGLAIVYGVVKDHNGYIDIKSELNKGTEAYVYLPVIDSTLDNEGDEEIIDIRGDEQILVVDDIPEQRDLAATVLSSLGYIVETVSSGEEAVEYLKSKSSDIVILDMIMDSGIDGLDTYRKIIEIHPGQRAIIVSGYSETDRVKEAQRLGAGRYVRKPYTMQMLGKAIREVLSS